MNSYFKYGLPPAALMQPEESGFKSNPLILPAVEFESGLSTCRDLASALSYGPGVVALVGPSGSGKSFVLNAFMRPPPSSAQRAAVRNIDEPLNEDITLDLIDNVDAEGIASLATAPNAIRRVLALRPDTLGIFQHYFPASPVVHMRPLASADLRVLLDARRKMLGLPIGSITTRAALLLERRCSGSPREFDRLFMQTAVEARSSPRIAAEHVERAYDFLQSQSRKPADTEAVKPTACTQAFDSTPDPATAFVAGPAVKMAFATPSTLQASTTGPTGLAAEALRLLAHDHVAPQDAVATLPFAQATSRATRQPESSLALLSRPQTAEEAAKISRSRRKYIVGYGLKLARPALLAAAFVAVPNVVNMRQAMNSSMASLSRMVAGLDEPYLHANASLSQPPAEPNANAGNEQNPGTSAAQQSQVATESPPPGSDTAGGREHESPPEGQVPPDTALPRAQAPPPAQEPAELPASPSQPTLLASPSPLPATAADPQSPQDSSTPPAAATVGDTGPATTAAGVVPLEDGPDPQRMGKMNEGSRLLTLGKALLAIGQRVDAAEVLKTSAELGNLEAASVLDSFHPSSP